MEFTQENFDNLLKVAEENENYKKALKEEREKRKQTDAEKIEISNKLSELSDFKKELEEKEAKKKGKYEDIIAEKDAKIKELTDENSSIKPKAEKLDEFLNKSLEDKLSEIPEEKQEFVKKVLEGKTHEEKLELLGGFVEDYKKPDFKAKAKDGDDEAKDTSEYEKAKKAGDIQGMLANAPAVSEG